jgi:hypothetical protein
MKTNLLTTVFIICASALYGNSAIQPEPDSAAVLELQGKILNSPDKGPAACRIYLLSHNKVIDSVVLRNGKKKFSFFLSKDNYYTLKMSMPGFLDKLLCVDTKNSSQPVDADLYSFSFETSLYVNDPAVYTDNDLADFPIAIIYFDTRFKRFAYNKEYTNSLRRDLHLATSGR